MMNMKTSTLLGCLLVCFAALPLKAALSPQPEPPVLPQPSTELLPADVVRTVVNALASNDNPYPDAGIATTFAFASPANKVNTGPLGKFTNMVKGGVYGIMVDHVKSEFSEVVIEGDQAFQMVQLTGKQGRSVVFAFRLGKQQAGEFEGMWMTDAVWPVSPVTNPEPSVQGQQSKPQASL